MDDEPTDAPADPTVTTDPESATAPPAPLDPVDDATTHEPAPEQPGSAPADLPAPSGDPKTPTIEWTPTGEPLRFRVGGQDISPTGALVDEKYVHIPKQVWDEEIAKKYVGPVEQYGKQVAGYQAALREKVKQLESLEPERDHRIQVANQFMEYLAKAPDEELAQFILDRRQRLPLMVAEQRIALLQKQQEQQSSEADRVRVEQEDDATEQYLQGTLETRAKALMGSKDYALLTKDPNLLPQLRTLYGAQLFRAIDRSEAELAKLDGLEVLGEAQGSLRGKLIAFSPGALRQILDERLVPLKDVAATYQSTKAAETHNAKVLSPVTKVAPKPAPQRPRDANGKFVEAPPPEKLKGLKALRAMSLTDMDDD